MVPLCLCVFVANFFGCVKGGTHPKNICKKLLLRYLRCLL
ncbi:Uncharacterized protein dnm_010350 [Desulfonema magnum]|uniref:Uncharacterized protein n=1 Tax=Desulfonema magnum TaxID=45655 RepID=A0A975GKR6_9BACT|nr:Uncharacterized protein dnm_010350 [Desulfonema magnum]